MDSDSGYATVWCNMDSLLYATLRWTNHFLRVVKTSALALCNLQYERRQVDGEQA